MSTEHDLNSLKRQSRIAALLYFFSCLPAPFALLYVPGALIVRGDAAATANNVRNSEALLRLGMAVELLSATIVIFAMIAFYRLFKAVSHKHALAMMILFLLSVPISYLNVLNDVAALTCARAPAYLSAAFNKAQLDALVLFFFRLHNHGIIVAQIFWGLWLFPFGIAAIRSGFIPLCRDCHHRCGIWLRNQFVDLFVSAPLRAGRRTTRHDSWSRGTGVPLAGDLGRQASNCRSCPSNSGTSLKRSESTLPTKPNAHAPT
jgi:hypothetical protein